MKLSIVACPDYRQFRPYVKRATLFFAQELIASPELGHLVLKIQFDKKLEEYGYASLICSETTKKEREYLIEINPHIGARDIFETLAHEMVHIKQYVYGETNQALTRWKGQLISADVDYFSHPWEIEAYGMSRGLVTKFVVQEKLWDIFSGVKDPRRSIQPESLGWIKPLKSFSRCKKETSDA